MSLDRSDVLPPRPLKCRLVQRLRHRRVLGSQPAIGEPLHGHLRRRRFDGVAHRVLHREHGQVELGLPHRREAALLRLGVIGLAIVHTAAAAVYSLVLGG